MRQIVKDEIVAEYFSDIFEYRKVLATRSPNKVFAEHTLSSESGSEKFTGTKTFAEANDLMFSYSEGMDAILQSKAVIKTSQKIRRTRISVIGQVPHIGNFLKGHPCDMIYRETIHQDVKEMALYYDRGQYADIKTETIIRSGRNLLDAVRMLEASGIRITIYIMDASVERSQCAIPIVKLKGSADPLNILKMAYCLVHPSFNRRHTFRWLETCPLVTDRNFAHGYGSTLSQCGSTLSKRRDYLIRHGLLTAKDVVIDCDTINRIHSADELVSLLEEQTSLSLEGQVRRAI